MPQHAFRFDPAQKREAWEKPRRGIGFEEARELFSRPYWLDQRTEVPEQYLAIGWVEGRLYSVIFEFREDAEGEYIHMVTLWRSTKEEVRLYEEKLVAPRRFPPNRLRARPSAAGRVEATSRGRMVQPIQRDGLDRMWAAREMNISRQASNRFAPALDQHYLAQRSRQ
ncbi:MAG: BrnT family toxin [Bryobacterales bacterium]|nr:BrnT family toxin [Bryobacterales bacterium]